MRAVPLTTTQCSARCCVLLQRQLRARLDRQALDLEARARVHAVVASPGPEYFAVQAGLAAPGFLHLLHEPLDVLHAFFRGDHDGVLGLDDDVALESHGGDQALGRVQQAILGRPRATTSPRVTLPRGIGRQRVLERCPGPDVTPARGQRNDGGARRLLHDRVVDRIGAAGLERRRSRRMKSRSRSAVSNALRQDVEHPGSSRPSSSR